MKNLIKIVWLLSFAPLSIGLKAQTELTTNRILIFGEFRLDKKPLPWQDFELIEYNMNLIRERDKKMTVGNDVEVYLYAKEKYYPKAGTEFLITTNQELPGKFLIRGGYLVTLKERDTIRVTDHAIPIDITDAKRINKNTLKLSNGIDIGSPEELSLVVMINGIYKRLHKENLEEGGFSNVVTDLNNFKSKYLQQSDKNINFEKLVNFYKLMDFIEYYTNENSFFIDEASKLNRKINNLNNLIENRKIMREMNESQKDSLKSELINSNKIFSAYQETYQEIKTYYTELQLIIFSFNCGVSELKNLETIKQEKHNKKKWKTDFTVGLAFSFGNNSQDQQLFFQKSDADFTLEERDKNNFISPSISSMVVHYLNTEKTTAFGLHYGVGANFQTSNRINLGLFAGLSMFIGRARAISINSGLSLLPVRRLNSPPNQIGDNFQFQVDINTVSDRVFKASPFISITYNLTK